MPVRRVLDLEWPRRYPVVQFPNAPLLVALAASGAARLTDGTAHDVAFAVATAGFGAWAGWEVVDGDNAFRRVLGVAGLAWVVTRVV